MLRILKQKKGFTLIELILVLTILGVVMVPMSAVLFFMNQTYYIESDTKFIQERARDTVDRIIEDLRKYDSGMTSVTNHVLNRILSIVYNDPVLGTCEITYTYTISNRKLVRSFSKSNNIPVNEEIMYDVALKNVSFVKVGNLINISVSVSYGRGKSIEVKDSYRIKILPGHT